MAHDAEIVRDEDVGEVELVLEVLEQVDDLGLDRDVERGDRLVGDDQLRPQRERAGDPDPLALSAGELVRIAVVVLRLEPHPVHQLLNLAAELRPGCQPVQLQRIPDDLPDALAGVERRVGVLEDHLDLAPHWAKILAGEPDHLLAAVLDGAGGRLEQLDDRPAERRLAAAGLADQPEGLALVQGDADVVDGLDARHSPVEEDSRLDREVLDEVLDLEDRIALRHG